MSRLAEPVRGTGEDRTTGFFFEAWHNWDSFLPGMNWRDFCFVHLGGEFNAYTGRVEFEVCLLGLWAKLTYVWNDAFNCEMREMMAAVRERDADLPDLPRDLDMSDILEPGDEPEVRR